MEKWIKVLEHYEISSQGKIRSLKTKRELKCFSNKGYDTVKLHLAGRRNYFIHRLVAEAFIPNSENKPFINHKNGISSDNRAENLEWCTQKENIHHSRKVTMNGAVVSVQRVKSLYEANRDITLKDFVELLIKQSN